MKPVDEMRGHAARLLQLALELPNDKSYWVRLARSYCNRLVGVIGAIKAGELDEPVVARRDSEGP